MQLGPAGRAGSASMRYKNLAIEVQRWRLGSLTRDGGCRGGSVFILRIAIMRMGRSRLAGRLSGPLGFSAPDAQDWLEQQQPAEREP